MFSLRSQFDMSNPFKRSRLRWGRAVFYGWWLALLALFFNALMTTPVWGGVGVWLSALELQFGWSRSQMALAFSLGQLEGSVSGPFVGFLVDKIGSRRVILSGTLVVGVGFVMFSFVTSLHMFYISFAVIMLGASSGGWMPMMAALNKWFDRKRSLAMGIASSGFSMGGMALVPILAWSVAPEHIGWQLTARWIGIVFLVIAWPFSQLVRNRPEDYGQIPDGESNTGAQLIKEEVDGSVLETGFTAREAVRTKAFWLIAIGQSCTTMTLATLTVHLVPSLVDQGLTLQKASFVWATTLGISWVSQLVGGYVGDKVKKNVAMAILSWIMAAGICFAAFTSNPIIAFIFAVVYGLSFGARIPLASAIRGEYFGRKAFGTIMGLNAIPMSGFMMAGPLFAGVVFDTRGSYFLAFMVLAGVAVLGGFLLLSAKAPTFPAKITTPGDT